MGDRSKTVNTCVGNRIKALRETNGLSQKELGKIVNKGDSAVRMWELGNSEPDCSTLIILADHFNVSIDYLLGIDNTIWTAEDYANGVVNTKKVSITADEEDILTLFKKIGDKLGEKGQRAFIEMGEALLTMEHKN